MCRLWEYLDGVIRYFCLSQIDTVSYRGILSQDFQICQTLIKGLSTVSSFWSTPNFTCKVADVELHLKKKVFVCFVSISGLLSQTEAINVLDFFFFFFCDTSIGAESAFYHLFFTLHWKWWKCLQRLHLVFIPFAFFCHRRQHEECNNLGKLGSYYDIIRSKLAKERSGRRRMGGCVPLFQSHTNVILGFW